MNFTLCISEHYTVKGSAADVGSAPECIPRTWLYAPAALQPPVSASSASDLFIPPTVQSSISWWPHTAGWTCQGTTAPGRCVITLWLQVGRCWEVVCTLVPEEPVGVSSTHLLYWLHFLPHFSVGIFCIFQMSCLHSGRTYTKIGHQAKREENERKGKRKKRMEKKRKEKKGKDITQVLSSPYSLFFRWRNWGTKD